MNNRKALMQPLDAVAGFEDLQKQMRKNRGVIEVTGTVSSEQAHLAAGLAHDQSREQYMISHVNSA